MKGIQIPKRFRFRDGACPDVIMFTFDYPPQDGGIARLCAEIVQGLKSNVSLVLSQHRRHKTSIEVLTSVEEYRVSAQRPWREARAWWRLIRTRAETKVIAGIWYPEGLLALLAGKRHLIVLAHGAELGPPAEAWRQGLWTLLQRFTLEHAELIVANSDYTARYVTRVAPRARVRTIPLAVDHNRFYPGNALESRQALGIPHAKHVITTVCRIHTYKGIDLVLHAIARLSPVDREDLLYVIAGKGPAVDQLKELADDLGVASNVRWLGYIPDGDLPDLYRASDLFVLCTREALERQEVEGFGMVFLEAQSCGIPVVGTRSGGIPDAVQHGEGGWLIAQDDVEALAGILRLLVSDSSVFVSQGLRGRARIEREYTWGRYLYDFKTAMVG